MFPLWSAEPSSSQDFRLCVTSLRCSSGHQSGAVSRPRDFRPANFQGCDVPEDRSSGRIFDTWLGPFNRLVTLMRLTSFREITLFYKWCSLEINGIYLNSKANQILSLCIIDRVWNVLTSGTIASDLILMGKILIYIFRFEIIFKIIPVLLFMKNIQIRYVEL